MITAVSGCGRRKLRLSGFTRWAEKLGQRRQFVTRAVAAMLAHLDASRRL
jgi:hypothetical protein